MVSGFLLLATAVWFPFAAKDRPVPEFARVVGGPWAVRTLQLILLVFAVFTVAVAAGWITFFGPFFSVVRAVIFSAGALGAFALAYLLGRRKLTALDWWCSLVLLVIAVAALATSLLLFQSLGLWFLITIGFVLGGGRVPWRAATVILVAFVLLHEGKFEMRERYWETPEDRFSHAVSPGQYPAFFAEWLGLGIVELFGGQGGRDQDEPPTANLLDRASLLQLLIFIDQSLGAGHSTLGGSTYLDIPELLVPRAMTARKITTSESNAKVAIHFGLQDAESANFFSIGWGPLNEAYANFGLVGIAGAAVFFGLFFGWATAWTQSFPVLSLRGLIAVLFMNIAFQSEFVLGQTLSVLFQGTVALMILAPFITRVQAVEGRPARMSLEEFAKRVLPRRIARRFFPRSPIP